ncbi:winged helix-turn-helix domain-containing protein [Vibrio sp. WXL103]|uniref:winged helix-turn-helix domain-containing protein n=1 Tax=Vibrio sp. WXL103 TaxID=3450710 RepID=UPI003EC8E2FD
MTKLTLEAPVYQLGDILFSPTSGVIEKKQSLYKLRAKECALLDVLIKQFPNLLSRNDIVENLYKNTYATDATINQLVKRLRNSLDDDKRSLIRTIPKQGYQLAIAPSRPPAFNTCNEDSQPSPINTLDTTQTVSIAQPVISSDLTSKQNDINTAERNLERFCGAIAVVGIFISVLLGYYYAKYYQLGTIQYLEPIKNVEVESELIIDDRPIALFEENQLDKIMLRNDGNIITCDYNQNTNITICQ